MKCFAVITDVELAQNRWLPLWLKMGLWGLAGVQGWKKVIRTSGPFGELRFYK